MLSSELLDKITKYLEENKEEVIDFLRDLVNLEGQHGEKEKCF